MPQPELQRAADNPWPEWPKTLLVDYGQREAIAVQGDDPRHYQTMTKRLVGDENVNVSEVHTVNVVWQNDASGRPIAREQVGTEKVIPADMVLLAMGFTGPEMGVLEKFGVTLDNRTNVAAEYGDFATSVAGIYACGDARRGQSLVVWAIDEGRRCAKVVDAFLKG